MPKQWTFVRNNMLVVNGKIEKITKWQYNAEIEKQSKMEIAFADVYSDYNL